MQLALQGRLLFQLTAFDRLESRDATTARFDAPTLNVNFREIGVNSLNRDLTASQLIFINRLMRPSRGAPRDSVARHLARPITMLLTLGQAAKLANHGKTTLTRAIKAGRLSAIREADGSYKIDPAELARVYQIRIETPETVSRDRRAVHRATPSETPETVSRDTETAIRMAELETELRALKELLAEVKASRDEMRAERDDWRGRADRLLSDQRYAQTPAPKDGISDLLSRLREKAAAKSAA